MKNPPQSLASWARLAPPTMDEVDQLPRGLRHHALEWRRLVRVAEEMPREGHWSIERAWWIAQEEAREAQAHFWGLMASELERELKESK